MLKTLIVIYKIFSTLDFKNEQKYVVTFTTSQLYKHAHIPYSKCNLTQIVYILVDIVLGNWFLELLYKFHKEVNGACEKVMFVSERGKSGDIIKNILSYKNNHLTNRKSFMNVLAAYALYISIHAILKLFRI